MNDINHFNDYLIDSFEVDGCFWRRLDGRVRDFSGAIKRMAIPAAAAMTMGAAVFAAPADVWASDYASVSPTNASKVVPGVSRFKSSYSHTATKKDKSSDKEDWAASEVRRLRGDLFSILERYKAGEATEVSQSVLDFAKEVSQSNQQQAVTFLGNSFDQSNAIHRVAEPPHSIQRVAQLLKVFAS